MQSEEKKKGRLLPVVSQKKFAYLYIMKNRAKWIGDDALSFELVVDTAPAAGIVALDVEKRALCRHVMEYFSPFDNYKHYKEFESYLEVALREGKLAAKWTNRLRILRHWVTEDFPRESVTELDLYRDLSYAQAYVEQVEQLYAEVMDIAEVWWKEREGNKNEVVQD